MCLSVGSSWTFSFGSHDCQWGWEGLVEYHNAALLYSRLVSGVGNASGSGQLMQNWEKIIAPRTRFKLINPQADTWGLDEMSFFFVLGGSSFKAHMLLEVLGWKTGSSCHFQPPIVNLFEYFSVIAWWSQPHIINKSCTMRYRSVTGCISWFKKTKTKEKKSGKVLLLPKQSYLILFPRATGAEWEDFAIDVNSFFFCRSRKKKQKTAVSEFRDVHKDVLLLF